MATVFLLSRSLAVSWLTSVLFPAPGGPVMPRMRARPVWGKTSLRRVSASGRRASIQLAALASVRVSLRSTGDPPSVGFQELAGDDELLDFAGAFADGAEFGVAEEFFH